MASYSTRKRSLPVLNTLSSSKLAEADETSPSEVISKVIKEEVVDDSPSSDDINQDGTTSSENDEDVETSKVGNLKREAKTTKGSKKKISLPDQSLLPNLLLKIMPMPVLRRNALSVADKLEILECLKKGESQYSVSMRLKLSRSTIGHIWKRREWLEKTAEDGNSKMKKCRMPNSLELEKTVASWFGRESASGNTPTGPEIRNHAKKVAEKLGINNFSASHGWLDRFKSRNEIVLPHSRKFLNLSQPKPRRPRKQTLSHRPGPPQKPRVEVENDDEYDDNTGHWDVDDFLEFACERDNASDPPPIKSAPPSSSKKASNEWLSKTWSQLKKGYTPKDIFFVDEIALFYRVLLENYKDCKGLSCFNGELANERLSVLLGTNAVGSEKLKLAVVGSSPQPTSFGPGWNRGEQDKLPVEYWFHPKAFITADIIAAWLSRWNAQMELNDDGRKVLLVLSNSTAHKSLHNLCSALKCIKIVILPAAVTAGTLHHLENDIGVELKTVYRKLLIDKFIRKMDNNDESMKISILEACGFLSAAWNGLDADVISEVFQKSGLVPKASSDALLAGKLQRRKIEERSNAKSLIQSAKMSGLKFPKKDFTFTSFLEVDENLIAVDQSLDMIDERC